MSARFLTGPVALRPEVQAAFDASPLSHRDPRFIELVDQTRNELTSLVNGSRVALMLGSGTLANDAIAAQLRSIDGSGLILSNGEFGQRLIDHARRWDLRVAIEWLPWGEAFDWQQVRQLAARCRPAWIWAVLTETSTGVANPLDELIALAESADAALCLDAVSAIGLSPVDLSRVRLASAVSGKGLASFPGLAAVFHHGRLASSARVPRYLDLASYDSADGVPFTHSSNLVAALHASLVHTDWAGKFTTVRRKTERLRDALRAHSLPPLARDEHAAPGVVTVPLPGLDVPAIAAALAARGIEVAHQSSYLRERNWLQIALMGHIDETALRRLPDLLAAIVAQQGTKRGERRSRA